MENETACHLCPRACGAYRAKGETGFCGVADTLRIARADLHLWEEPCISGTNGSGAIFFSGCGLGCVFCQNYEISARTRENTRFGYEITPAHLAELCFTLKEKGAHNINLVTGAHFAPQIRAVLEKIKPELHLPVVWNSSGYETPQTIELLSPVVDIFLPDMKFLYAETARRYCDAPNYPEIAFDALHAMLQAQPKPVFQGNLLQSGVIVRHLVLPRHRKESAALLEALAARFGTENYLLSLMSQYIPAGFVATPAGAEQFPELNRRLSTFEYNRVCETARELGFDGYVQERTAASKDFIPAFHDSENKNPHHA